MEIRQEDARQRMAEQIGEDDEVYFAAIQEGLGEDADAIDVAGIVLRFSKSVWCKHMPVACIAYGATRAKMQKSDTGDLECSACPVLKSGIPRGRAVCRVAAIRGHGRSIRWAAARTEREHACVQAEKSPTKRSSLR
eukprot:43469-Rhodomonas_salina.1